MKSKYVLALFIISLAYSPMVKAKGIVFEDLTFAQAKQKAQATGKYIFIDFYATWCGPCKYLEKEVFTIDSVGEYFNTHFVNIRIDAEEEELGLVESIFLEAYPTLVIFDKDGNQMISSVGVLEADELLAFGKKAADYEAVFAAYKNNPNEYEVISTYLSYVVDTEPNRANDIALTYLNKLDTSLLLTDEAYGILNYVNDYSSSVITYVYNNLDESPSYLPPFFDDLTYKLMNKALYDAVEQQDLALLAICKNIEINYHKANGTLFEPEGYYRLDTDMLYYQNLQDLPTYARLLDTQCRTYYWDDEVQLTIKAIAFAEKYASRSEIDAQTMALAWIAHSRTLDDTDWMSYYAEAMVYYYNREFTKALPAAKKAYQLADKEDEPLMENLTGLIAELEG
jgi:thioredoxin-related protein